MVCADNYEWMYGWIQDLHYFIISYYRLNLSISFEWLTWILCVCVLCLIINNEMKMHINTKKIIDLFNTIVKIFPCAVVLCVCIRFNSLFNFVNLQEKKRKRIDKNIHIDYFNTFSTLSIQVLFIFFPASHLNRLERILFWNFFFN